MTYSLNETTVLTILKIRGPMTHKELIDFFDCGYFALDSILRKLCKDSKVDHNELFTKKGYKNQHLFIPRKDN